MSSDNIRSEQAVLEELATLCTSPGYIHAIAFFCFRDNIIGYSSEMTEADMQKMCSSTRLIRMEITTLIGLIVKAEVDYTMPAPETLQSYISETDRLLVELHHAMSRVIRGTLTKESLADPKFNPLARGEALREPIFYGGESAYDFQYRDLAVKKYAADNVWLESNKGFSIETARAVVHAVERIQSERLPATLQSFPGAHPDEWTILPGFTFTATDVVTAARIDKRQVERVLRAFTLSGGERNADFKALQDYNAVSAAPLLRMPDGRFLSLQSYALAETLYESPCYWMTQDKEYLPTLMANRGRFTESIVREQLTQVFGQERVFANVDIHESKSTKVGEIDVLVLFGDRAIVVQAKSKRLTLEARKGNDQVIRDDFRKSVQDAYDQAVRCARCLGDSSYVLTSPDAQVIALPHELKEVYIFCVVSDHYPALSFQARQFLRAERDGRIKPPLVLDVFALDAMTEMLHSPLQFLSYVDRRSNYADRLHASHELTILAYHLKYNLWFDDEMDMISLGDDFSAGLDIAMAVRRDGVSGSATPDGILTRFASTTLGRIVKEIEDRPDPATIDFGFMFLTLSEETVKDASRGIDNIAARARADGRNHDLTLSLSSGTTGLTIHCNDDAPSVAGPRLWSHCEMRKYTEKADTWFGLCLSPKGASLRFGLNLAYKWKQSDTMDADTRGMKVAGTPLTTAVASLRRRVKVGRNDRCPCGSGLKYKKCCLTK